VALGLHHEQQHQELILTDLKYNLGNNPLKPVYLPAQPKQVKSAMPLTWHDYAGGLVEIGAKEHGGFVYDNEKPRHKVYLDPFQLASRTVTNGEFLGFVRDGGYDRPELWLSDGWAHLAALGPERWRGPLYWREDGDEVLEYTLAGEAPLDLQAPVCHVSGFEADAYARWCNARLPTEAEWETAAACAPMTGNFVDAGVFHPAVSAADSLYGNVWEWTASSYGPYPGFKPFAGQLGEYNGKFMANQLVLRGGSCATPQSHIRPTYRNFFYPPDRWQFSGIRLARDVG
jgi:ergothioneine biosynthesis protein EgtB